MKLASIFLILSFIFMKVSIAEECNNSNPIFSKFFIKSLYVNTRKPGFHRELEASDLSKYDYYIKVTFIDGLPKLIEAYYHGKIAQVTRLEEGLLIDRVTYPYLRGGKLVSCLTNETTNYKQVCINYL